MPDHFFTLTDTHAHISYMVKQQLSATLTPEDIDAGKMIVTQAADNHVTRLIDVGTSIAESRDCITFSKHYPHVWAAIAIHPESASSATKEDITQLQTWATQAHDLKIVAIGECGIDTHYPGYNLTHQRDLFKAHIEIALQHNLALIIHSRDAAQETLTVLDEYRKDGLRGIMHCYSYDRSIAQETIALNFKLGIGGTVTYPKNNELRAVVTEYINDIVLETDAPFLPIQSMRGKKNHPLYIRSIAEFIAELKGITIQEVSKITEQNVDALFPAMRLPTDAKHTL